MATCSGEKTLPDFLIIGAAKSGTSALYQYLSQHPQIFMPTMKEIRYFAYDDGEEARYRLENFGKDHFSVRTLAAYEALFAQADPLKVWGEASPIYLESDTAAERIRSTIPNAKLIASLRNPITRAFSGYLMQVRSGREHRSIEDAFDKSAHHVKASFYFDQVRRYYDLFPREQILTLKYESFKLDNEATLSQIFEFLGVDPSYRPRVSEKHNVGSYPRLRFLNAMIENSVTRDVVRPLMPRWIRKAARSVKKMNLGDVPGMPPETHARLLDVYQDDINRLHDLTGLSVESWLKPPSDVSIRSESAEGHR